MTERKKSERKKLCLKIFFYFSSLTILFALLFVLMIGRNSDDGISYDCYAYMALILACIGLASTLYLRSKKFAKSFDSNGTIKAIRNEDYEYLAFLTTYIIPLVCLDFEEPRYWVILMILLLIIGVIIVKTGQYCGNPTLALLGYRLYRVEINSDVIQDEIVLITTSRLKKGSAIKWVTLDNHVVYGRGTNNA